MCHVSVKVLVVSVISRVLCYHVVVVYHHTFQSTGSVCILLCSIPEVAAEGSAVFSLEVHRLGY
jgi:hypothetical protein